MKIPPRTQPRKALTDDQAIAFVQSLVTAVNRSKYLPLEAHVSVADDRIITATFLPTRI